MFPEDTPMTALRAKIQNFSRERLMLVLSVYIICQPLLDVLTAQGVHAGHPVMQYRGRNCIE